MRFHVFRARRGLFSRPQWRWRLTADNHKIIAVSSESYNNRIDCLAAIAAIIGLSDDTPVAVDK